MRRTGRLQKGTAFEQSLEGQGGLDKGPKESAQQMPEGGTGAGLAVQRRQALWSGEAM